MSWFEERVPSPSSVPAAAEEEDDRRFNGRNCFLAPIQIQRLNPPHGERSGTMRDLSRDGLYFVVRSQEYGVGDRLRVTLPQSKSEWNCEVAHTEMLPSGGQGVGVRFLVGSGS